MDRNNKATLPLTALCTVFKSSAKDLDLPKLEIIIRSDFHKEVKSQLPHRLNPILRYMSNQPKPKTLSLCAA